MKRAILAIGLQLLVAVIHFAYLASRLMARGRRA